jgi:hypothetical protein
MTDMRKIILPTIALFIVSICTNTFAQMADYQKKALEPDTIFSVYLEKDTANRFHSVFLVFENTSNDSILLFSRFKLFFDRFITGSELGFMMNFYQNGQNVMPTWGQWPYEQYVFSDGKTRMPPHSIIRFRIGIPSIGIINADEEFLLNFMLNYMYFNLTKKEGRLVSMETNRLDLGYLNSKTRK